MCIPRGKTRATPCFGFFMLSLVRILLFRVHTRLPHFPMPPHVVEIPSLWNSVPGPWRLRCRRLRNSGRCASATTLQNPLGALQHFKNTLELSYRVQVVFCDGHAMGHRYRGKICARKCRLRRCRVTLSAGSEGGALRKEQRREPQTLPSLGLIVRQLLPVPRHCGCKTKSHARRHDEPSAQTQSRHEGHAATMPKDILGAGRMTL